MGIQSKRRGSKEAIKDGHNKSPFLIHAVYVTIIVLVIVGGWGQRIPLLKNLYAGTSVLTLSSEIKSYEQLLKLPSEQLDKIDIALMNLICAKGLNGSEKLDIDKCLSTIDKWTELIRADTQSRLPLYYQNPAKYDDSENVFKVVNMVLYLQDECGVHYDPACIGNWDFSNSNYIFIQGLLDGERSGTCTSIPTLCVAIGRRLGYPLKLALAKGHVFFRWDGKETFNIEACCISGVDKPDNEYYEKWPNQMNAMDIQKGCFLKSLTAKEELALFVGNRAASLKDNGRYYEANVAYANSCLLKPNNVPMLLDLLGTIDYQINKIAEGDSKITGKPSDYAIRTFFDGKESYYVWEQKCNRPSGKGNIDKVGFRKTEPESTDIEALVRRAEMAKAARQSLYGKPVPTPMPMPTMPRQ